MNNAEEPPAISTVYQPDWDDNPTWEASRLFTDLDMAKKVAQDTYVQDLDIDEHDSGGTLTWQPGHKGRWELLEGGEPTPVSIEPCPVFGTPAAGEELTFEEMLAIATEFRIPLPQGSAGGYGEIVVGRDGISGRWAVTDGAVTGLQVWDKRVGWRRVSDVGRVAAYTLTCKEAIVLGRQVAEFEGAQYQATIAAARPAQAVAPPTRQTAEDPVTATLTTVVATFHIVTGCATYDSDLCWDVLRLLLTTLPLEDLLDYPKRLEQFAAESGMRLRRLYREFGPGSLLAAHGRYELVCQPVSIALFERLDTVPMLVLGTLQGELPEEWLADAASAWGTRLPE